MTDRSDLAPAYQRVTWIGDCLLSSCPICGAVVVNRVKHTAWHRDYCQGPIPGGGDD